MDQHNRSSSNRRAVFALIALCVLAWVPGFFTLPPLDRDESRFAQATKQMLESGNFVDIRFGTEARYEKPVGIYWLQAASTAVLGAGARDTIWTYRVPSFFGALAAVIATFFIARLFSGIEASFASAAVLALSVLLMTEAKIAKTDAMLAGTVALAELVMMRGYLSTRIPGAIKAPSTGMAMLGWAAFGLGVLVKGPLIALVCGLTAAAVSLWDRDARWLATLKAGRGVVLALLIVAPWLIAIGIASHGQFFQQSVGQDFSGKIMGEAEAHGAPPGYFTVLAHATLWPGSFALLPALLLAWKRRNDPAIRYLLCWAVPAWLMFELVPTKLPHYVLPAYPALAVLCGLWLAEPPSRESILERIARILSLVTFVGVGLGLTIFFAMAPSRLGDGSPWWLYTGAAVAGVAIIGVIPFSEERWRAGIMAAFAAVILYQVAGFLTVPRVNALWLSPRLADAALRRARPNDPPIITAGYAEPSIRFLLGTDSQLKLGQEAGAIAAKAGGLVLVDAGEDASFLAAITSAGAHAAALEAVDGINYSRGRAVHITLYRVEPPPS